MSLLLALCVCLKSFVTFQSVVRLVTEKNLLQPSQWAKVENGQL